MFEIAQRNKSGNSIYQSVEEVKKAYHFSCLQDFLDIYYAGASVLFTKRFLVRPTMAYFKHCAEENVVAYRDYVWSANAYQKEEFLSER